MSYLPPIEDSDVLDGLSVGYVKIFGLWSVINDYRRTGEKSAVIKLIITMTFLLSLPYILGQCLSYFVIKVDIQKATFLNIECLPCLQFCCEIFIFWFRMDSQGRLYGLVRKDFLKIPEHKMAEVGEICRRITGKCNMFCLAAALVNFSIIFLSIADPGISVDYILHHTGNMAAVTGGRKKILGGWYPVPMAESPYYEIIFAYETVLTLYGGVLLTVYTCYFYQVLMCLYAQFAILGYHASTLKLGSTKKTGKNIHSSYSEMYLGLYDIIQDHKKLLRNANELRSLYNPLVTIILGIGTFVLILAVFQFMFGGGGSSMFVFRSMQFLAYKGIEVCMFCLGSSYIQEASSELQFAIYSSDWYRADTKFRKAAQMLMVRARKGVTLTAIRMYPVNAETIMSILQSTYSVSALMSRMSE